VPASMTLVTNLLRGYHRSTPGVEACLLEADLHDASHVAAESAAWIQASRAATGRSFGTWWPRPSGRSWIGRAGSARPRVVDDVLEVDADELGAAEGAGETHQKEGAIAQPALLVPSFRVIPDARARLAVSGGSKPACICVVAIAALRRPMIDDRRPPLRGSREVAPHRGGSVSRVREH
jgi:hypothetical protein